MPAKKLLYDHLPNVQSILSKKKTPKEPVVPPVDIQIKNKGSLKAFGYSTKVSDKQRQSALVKAIHEYGRTSVIRKLVALQNLNKNRPIYTIFHKDLLFVEKQSPDLLSEVQRGGQIIMVNPSNGQSVQFHQFVNDMTPQQAINMVKSYYAQGFRPTLLTSDVVSQLAQQGISVPNAPPTFVAPKSDYHTIYSTGGKNVPMMAPLGRQPPPNPGMNNTVNNLRAAADWINGVMSD